MIRTSLRNLSNNASRRMIDISMFVINNAMVLAIARAIFKSDYDDCYMGLGRSSQAREPISRLSGVS